MKNVINRALVAKKKIFLTLAVFVMAICVNAQKNQYFWFNGNLMLGNPIAQIDSVTFGIEDTDSILLYLPRTIIKTVHDTVYITIHDTVCPNDIPEGASKGVFSVAADKKVRFSKGNLQYNTSTGIWRFAENQWDIIGQDNSYITPSYSGWIDRFGWGTGNNPTLLSSDNGDYQTVVDWGVNAISNGGNSVNLWRTLTIDELYYLFFTRSNAIILFGLGTVNGMNGLIILPDDWTTPEGVTFAASTTKGLYNYQDIYYTNDNDDNYSHNIYDIDQWTIMENAGAVFLPASDLRYDSRLGGWKWFSNYWTATPLNQDMAYQLYFYWDRLDPHDCEGSDNERNYHEHVRLVQDVE